MEILVYRYNSICEPDVIACFEKMGLSVVEETTQIHKKDTTPSDTVEAVRRLIDTHNFLFVFTINFFPAIAEVCNIYNIPYVSWTVDVPVQELFSPSLSRPCNRVFMFDRSQYEYFKDRNPGHIFHLPLATNVERWDSVIRSAPSLAKYSCDISFIGSLYHEKDPYPKVKGLRDYTKGYLDGLMEAQMQLWGCNFLEENITDAVLAEFDKNVPDMHTPLCEGDEKAQRYLIAHSFLGYHIAAVERQRYLSAVAEEFGLALYTLSDASGLPKAQLHPKGAKTLTEMPLVFHQSRINLNITMRPIATGLSLRLFDVCGCGGFLLTNWQEELPELYEPGVEVETYSSVDEMLDKCAWYLSHEDARKKIALAGLSRTRAQHCYEHRITEMIRTVNATL